MERQEMRFRVKFKEASGLAGRYFKVYDVLYVQFQPNVKYSPIPTLVFVGVYEEEEDFKAWGGNSFRAIPADQFIEDDAGLKA